MPSNNASVTNPPSADVSSCYNSFSDIDRATFKAVFGPPPTNPTSTSKVVVIGEGNYKEFVSTNIINHDLSSADRNKEQNRLNKFKYQYFLTQIGPAPFKGTGESIKKVQRIVEKMAWLIVFLAVVFLMMIKSLYL